MNRLIYKVAAALLMLLSVIFLIGLKLYNEEVDLDGSQVSIVVQRGDGFGKVVDQLVFEGVIESRLPIKLVARLTGDDKKLIPGRYDFVGVNSCKSVLKRLAEADFLRLKVTIPEGSTIWKTAQLLNRAMSYDSTEVIRLSRDSSFLQQLELSNLEGYLFPETYFFPWGYPLEDALVEMVRQYRTSTDSIWPKDIIGGLSRSEIVVLASIIEAETGLGSEREMVSSVYHNRLRKKMKLDADPTVIYGLGGLDRPLWTKDLKIETPYNTYLNKGLPPTPINSPGLKAIKAALYPAESEFLYFVADNSGGHRFSKTNAEHNRAIREIRGR
ncbi:MAG: endolytic transglycosylase MltG [bacterium]|nr:endolytic transglycosylase MltG [bacterium]